MREKEQISFARNVLGAYFAELEALTKCADSGKTRSAPILASLWHPGTKQCCWRKFREPKPLQKDKHYPWIGL